ncbi:MAG: aminotransferase class I/II-fold pyridoxal phosphate-dependent enzyme, partial [Candidatus Baltobacteraceae bacterium]
ALQIARDEPVRRERLHRNVGRLRSGLGTLGFATLDNRTPIVPVVLGEERRAIAIATHVFDLGIYAPAVRPPTVPEGTSRLRVSLRADHTEAQIDALLEALQCTAIL